MVLEDLRRPLRQKLNQVDGLLTLALSDVDGVLVIKVSRPEQKVANKVENVMAGTRYLSSYALALDQCEHLEQGQNRMLVAKFEKFQVVHFYQHKLLLTLVGNERARLGQLRQLARDLDELVADIARAVIKE